MTSAASVDPSRAAPASTTPQAQARITELVELHVDAVWRTLRRLGMPPADLDDGVQQVFTVFARRIDRANTGQELGFLLGIAVRVVSDHRRSRKRRPEDATDPHELERSSSRGDSPESLLDERRRLQLLDELIARLPAELAEVFVLFELEGLTMAEIARLLELPAGTVASRLRRARERFDASCRELEQNR
jgi:RNA polymerase sigma-70 factor (ECF subfamily)